MSISASLGEIVRREMAGICQLSDEQIARLESHYRLLVAWNKRINLTTVTDLPEAGTRHYCESLFLASRLTAGKVADIGSGAGFPGIPAAILRQDCEFDLVESHQRKAVFLKEATRGLANIRVLPVRAETLRSRYDWVISRAVDPHEVLKLEVSRQLALLLGDRDASGLRNAEIVPIPWGDHRVLAFVSRGTD